MARALHRWVERNWYGNAKGYWLLLPLAAVYWLVIAVRRVLYGLGILRTATLEVPVIVVGNITAGGTGKTPVTAWLATELGNRGFRPGIVSRGYGGSGGREPISVDAASDPSIVGDEPVLLARRAGCPVAVAANRVKAARHLVRSGIDVIIADDGMQHLALGRDYEICVLDGERWLGNRLLLPAGPLREPAAGLANVDQVLINGQPAGPARDDAPNAIEFWLEPSGAQRLDGGAECSLESFTGKTVHAVAAIGNPQRFFAMLRSFGIKLVEHAFADHAPLSIRDLSFEDGSDVLMTEKDAVKLGQVAGDCYWYVPVNLKMSKALARPWLAQIESRLRDRPEPS